MELDDILEKLHLPITKKDIKITKINTLLLAKDSELSYITSSKFIKDLKTTSAKAVFTKEEFVQFVPKDTVAIVVDNPELYMAYASRFFAKKIELPTNQNNTIGKGTIIYPNATIGNRVSIGNNCTIMANVFIGDDSTIGDNTTIYPNVTIYHDSIIGNHCIIHANSVIGSDGFGYTVTKEGEHIKIYQNGNVIIEDNVEIGSNCSIDRATFNSTIIRNGVKIDNLVQIAHNVEIKENSVIVSQSGVAGSSVVGKNVLMGAQSGISDHIVVADFTIIAARAGITKNTQQKKIYAGFPAKEHREWLKTQAKISKL